MNRAKRSRTTGDVCASKTNLNRATTACRREEGNVEGFRSVLFCDFFISNRIMATKNEQLYPMNENSRYPLSSSVSTPRYISVSLISQSRSNLVAPFHQRCPGKRGIINDPASRSGLLPVSFKLKQFEPPPSTFAGGSSQSKGQTWFNLINSRRNRRLVLITVDYRPVYV